MRGGYDPDRAARILADAIALGDKAAAKKWDCHVSTVGAYRKRLRTDTQLRELLEEKKKHDELDLATLRVAFMREAIGVLRQKMSKDDATIYEIAGAIKIVGELHQTSSVLDDERPDSPDPETTEAEGGTGREASLETH